MIESNSEEKSSFKNNEGKMEKEYSGNTCTPEFTSLLEEWKSLASSDANDDIWSSQKENFLFVAAFTSFGFAAKFTNECSVGMVIFASLIGVLLLLFNFVACEGINKHQFARRARLKEIEETLPVNFYSRQRDLMNLALNSRQRDLEEEPAMNFGLRKLRFSMILLGLICSLILIVISLLNDCNLSSG
jgi:hypothetical protein